MKSFAGWSIRTYLLLLVILSVAPALVIILYTGLEQKRDAISDVHIACTTVIGAVAADMDNTVAATRQLLSTLAAMPEVKRRDSAACNTLFAEILSRNPHYNTLQAFQPNGDLFASAVPPKVKLNMKDRKYFKDAIDTGDFSVGEYILGKIIKKPMINFGYPVKDGKGEVLAVMQTGIDLNFIGSIIGRTRLLADSTLVMVDSNGTILHHSAEPGKRLGMPDDKVIFSDMAAARGNETITSRQINGKNYIMLYKSLSMPNSVKPYLYIRLEMPEEPVLAGVSHTLTRNLGLMLMATLLAASAAFLFAHLSILRRARRLVVASEQLAAGNRDVRVGIPHDKGELGLIAQAFDRMSETLSQRDEERIRFVEELEAAVSWALDEKAKSEAVIASIGDGISIQDRNFQILYQNEVHRKMMGNHLGKICYETYLQNTEECESCPLRDCFDDGNVHMVEKALLFCGEPTYVLITASPLRDSTGEIVGGIELVKNITERKMNEIEREEMSRKLSDSNNELQHFAYIASHDLQEPLRTITSFIQLLAKRYQGKLGKDADEFIGFVTDGAQRMQRLINDLLAYSRVESKGKPFAQFDCGVVVEHTLANLRQAIEESGAAITHDQMPSMYGDEMQMVQLFQNLIGNAIKFRGSSPPLIRIGIVDKQDEWEISITDNGIGIEPKFFERIFEIFQRLNSREKYAGTGIGLAVCKKIVERHGGRIRVDSETGLGTTFTFTISKGLQKSQKMR